MEIEKKREEKEAVDMRRDFQSRRREPCRDPRKASSFCVSIGLQKLISDLPPIPQVCRTDMESRRADDCCHPIFGRRSDFSFRLVWHPIFALLLSNGAAYLEFADGIIVGTSVKRDGKVSNPVDSTVSLPCARRFNRPSQL